MSFDIIIILIIIVIYIILFITEIISYDIVALIVAGTLMVTGILTPEEGLSGFSNQATITIGAMFVLSEGLKQNGILRLIGKHFTSLSHKGFPFSIIVIMLISAVVSGFINNTAAVAIFIPVVIHISKNLKISPSKLLIPLSFASMFGGVCTLVGTSTNILVSSIAFNRGLEKFSIFEFSYLGLIFLLIGFCYLLFYGIKRLPERKTGELTEQYKMHDFITDVKIQKNYQNIGKKFKAADFTKDLDLDVLRIFKDSHSQSANRAQGVIEKDDVLRIRGGINEIKKLLRREDLSIVPVSKWYDKDINIGKDILLETIILPESNLVNKSLGEINLYDKFGAIVLAVRHKEKIVNKKLDNIKLNAGDSLLICVEKKAVVQIKNNKNFLIVSEIEYKKIKKAKILISLAILFGVVFTAALGWLPIVVSAIIGAILMIITNCLNPEQAYKSINWKVIFLLAGVLPLGIAMDKTGAARLISDVLINILGQSGPTLVLSGFLLITMLLTNIISNQASAALLAPIAIEAASRIGVDPKPLLMAVTYGASLSFMTPVGYQTNTMIFNPGKYKFIDFLKIGTPLNIILWIAGSFLIPAIWSF